MRSSTAAEKSGEGMAMLTHSVEKLTDRFVLWYVFPFTLTTKWKITYKGDLNEKNRYYFRVFRLVFFLLF